MCPSSISRGARIYGILAQTPKVIQKKKGFPIVWPHSTVLAMSEVLVLVFEGL